MEKWHHECLGVLCASCHFIFSSHSPTWAGGGSSSTGGYTLGLVEAIDTKVSKAVMRWKPCQSSFKKSSCSLVNKIPYINLFLFIFIKLINAEYHYSAILMFVFIEYSPQPTIYQICRYCRKCRCYHEVWIKSNPM